MPPNNIRWLFLASIGLTMLAATMNILLLAGSDLAISLVRLFGLYGFLLLGVATSTTPFIREMTQWFGKPFLKIHHAFAVFGIAFISLHPLVLALRFMNFGVFVPGFDSWLVFLSQGGRVALILLFLSVFSALLRKRMVKYWRSFHALMYVVLFLGVAHANLIGTDMKNPLILLLFNALFGASILAFFLKRYRTRKANKKRRTADAPLTGK